MYPEHDFAGAGYGIGHVDDGHLFSFFEHRSFHRKPTFSNRATRTGLPITLLYQFDLVAVGILDERDGGRAMLHRSRLAHDIDALLLQVGAGSIDVVDAECDMSVSGADIVLRGTPIPGQLDDGGIFLVAVADEGEGELAAGEIVLAQEFHPELVAVELQRLVEIVYSEHRVQHSHA